MLNNFLSSLKVENTAKPKSSRRRHSRRACDRCVTVIDDQMYPVIDWSIGGLQISGDERFFGVKQEVKVTMKFQLRDDILEIPHKAHVVRKNKGRIAFQFLPLSKETRAKLQSVVDDYMAREFVESQLV
ncbi:MAG: PilZ domain-containing protein [Alphaproteobacteria bacterium]